MDGVPQASDIPAPASPLAPRPDAPAASPGEALDPAIIEQVVIGGDLARLTPAQRVEYYRQVCASLNLNPLTRPFEYLRLNDRLTLYAKREATDQLRRLHGVSVEIVAREQQEDVYVVTARARTPEGRTDEATGAVSLAGLSGANLANGLMRAETKAKRRVTLSICGLGWLDESEVDSVPVARPVQVSDGGGIEDAAYLQKLRRRFGQVSAEAAALGIPWSPLPEDADEATIVRLGRALRADVDRARATGRGSAGGGRGARGAA
ncbi:MAG TPA: hypothetical protein VNK05_12835 [Chloroflexota bacterium]|nr:hypothetical protein [Chloroflexota bacterium]